jgi:hypothetical protein
MFLHTSVPHATQAQSRLHNHQSTHLPLPFLPITGPTPKDAFFHRGKVKMFVRIVRNVFLWLGKTPKHLASQTKFCGTPGQTEALPLGRQGYLPFPPFIRSYMVNIHTDRRANLSPSYTLNFFN